MRRAFWVGVGHSRGPPGPLHNHFCEAVSARAVSVSDARDMGQIDQHFVFLNHIAIGCPAEFLEYIPHLKRYFVSPVRVVNGTYCLPEDPGSSTDLIELLS